MSGQATTTANPQTSWGSNSIQNRVKPGGDLGSNQYYYTTESNTGKITVTRFERVKQGRGSFRNVETDIGNIPKGGSFTPNSDASSTEKSYYGNSTNLGKARSQALQVARREWDGKSQPSPNTSIYGDNAINAAYGATNSNGGTEDYTTPINFATGITGWDKIGDVINTGNLGSIFGSKSPLGRSGTRAVLVYFLEMEYYLYRKKKRYYRNSYLYTTLIKTRYSTNINLKK